MHDIEVIVKEGNPVNSAKPKSWRISLPANVAMEELLNAMIPKLELPVQQRDGRQIVYQLHHVQSGNTLSDNETLSDAGVANEDVCLLLRQQGRGDVSKVTKSLVARPEKAKAARSQKSYLDQLKQIIAEVFSVDEDWITPDTSLRDDLEADELHIDELVFFLDLEFDILIPYEDAENLWTVQDVIDYLKEHHA
jgi:acyl carrier protein